MSRPCGFFGGLRDSWSGRDYKRLIEELDATIAWMEACIAEVHPAVPKIRSKLRRITSSLRVIYSEK
ncbi:hypothetical protein [Halodesulfovibrio marinisediminis]|uniref:Four helix bundle protein n=1 Tax=Halodesulfovibrio marinisediminis DSM 17456 TaxID=1121457 RepID=A0A1N6FDF5_9BACT|nr:hypothetical protein [Halodesulfovibrio marinisediminis]SIN93254.1 hypothetical protein SAMN02745161_1254 [Halodesulfovibrio marinisediminis DSM 17456]